MGIGIWQLVIILLIVLLLFGAKRLRNIGGDLGTAIKGFRSAVKDGENGEAKTQDPNRIVDDNVIGKTSLSQVTVGLSLGGQKYAQFIFFKDDVALGHFKRGNYEMGAQASAVAVTAGASADANYDSGVAVFTNVGGGLMADASIGGQKFSYEAF